MEETNVKTRGKKVKYVESEGEEDEIDDSSLEVAEHENIERKRISGATKKQRKDDDAEDDYDVNSDSEINNDEEEEIEEEDNSADGDADDDGSVDDKIKTGKKRKQSKAAAKPKKEKVIKEKKPPREKKEKAPKKEKPPKKVKTLLDPEFNLEERYFYQDLNDLQSEEIRTFLTEFLKSGKTEINELNTFFENFEVLKRGDHNIQKLKAIIDEQVIQAEKNESFFKSYKILTDFIMSEFYQVKPSILECHFFPNVDNEVKVVNMLRTSKKTLDIAIFTLTNDKIFAGIEEAFNRGVKIRVIADDECCKMLGSDVIRCAAIGIPCKTDSDAKAHMHHKFCVIDNSVLITGSFNWTVQAVKMNQENILFWENKEMANIYTKEFNRLWNLFSAGISQEDSFKKISEEQEKKRIVQEQKEKEKEQRRIEKEEEKLKKKK